MFLHVPHSGGLTFRSVLESNFGKSKVAFTNERDKSLERKLKGVKALYGDVTMAFLDNHYREISKDWVKVVVLREPVSRVNSQYWANIATHIHENRNPRDYEDGDLDWYVKHATFGEDLSYHTLRPAACTGPQDCLTQIKTAMKEGQLVVGLLEHFDHLLVELKMMGLLPNTTYIKRGAIRGYPSITDQQLIQHIHQRNAYDYELYHYAKQLVTAKVARHMNDENYRSAYHKHMAIQSNISVNCEPVWWVNPQSLAARQFCWRYDNQTQLLVKETPTAAPKEWNVWKVIGQGLFIISLVALILFIKVRVRMTRLKEKESRRKRVFAFRPKDGPNGVAINLTSPPRRPETDKDK